MRPTSPFSQNRFEYEGRHLYYLPDTVFTRLQPAKPKYLIGSRGSGKTTLLKALCWDEQTSNESLMSQLSSTFIDRKYIGTYVKLPNTQLHLLDSWLHHTDSPLYGMIFSFYIELVSIQLISEALAQLAERELLSISTRVEHASVTRWLNASPFLRCVERPTHAVTLLDFADRASAARKSIEQHAIRKDDPSDVAIAFQLGQMGTTSSHLLSEMGTFSDEAAQAPLGTWHFKVCMDEGESLNERQQRVMRTMVRLAQWPLFPVLSFVRLPEDRTSTDLHRLTLQAADVEQIALDKMDKRDFKAFAEGVATIRAREFRGNHDLIVDLYTLLGALDLNRILVDILTASESPVAKELLAKARLLANESMRGRASEEDSNPIGDTRDSDESSLPVWQAYLIERLPLAYPHTASRSDQRRYESINLRKRMVAGYLSICRELQTAPRYASADMVLEICDNCIRDFLSQMDELFSAVGKSVEDFLSNAVPHEVQYRAIVSASKAKKESLPTSGVQSPVHARRIIEGLAFITSSLQASLPSDRHLEVPEQGKFAVELTESQAIKHKELLDILFDSAEAGFLRVLTENEAQPRFRVHTSLAPAFGFSYRGAYYDSWIAIGELERLRHEGTDEGVRRVATAIFRRLANDEPRPLLEEMS